jgi:hypothetical protein
MQHYDITLKSLLLSSKPKVVEELTGARVERWITTELPKVQNLRVDLLAETVDKNLVQIELQRKQEQDFPFRMLEYCLAITRIHGRVPHQIGLYIGPEPLRMPDRYEWPYGSARFTLIDIRDLDGESLLASPELGDNVISILARLKDQRGAVRRVVDKLSRLESDKSAEYVQMLLNLAGLRGLEQIVKEEVNRAMALDLDELVPQNKVLGPAYRKGMEEGLQKGERAVLRRQIERRFGSLPSWAETRFASLSPSELDDLSVRILDVQAIEQLFPEQ